MTSWLAPLNHYEIDGPRIRVTDENPKIGKISGTMCGAVLGLNPYMSPFEASANLLRVGTRDVSALPAVKAGKVLEDVVIDYIERTYNGMTVIRASDIFAPRSGDHHDWASDFDDPVFTGHVDGLIIIDGKEFILEVKTVRDLDMWGGSIPLHYYWQVALYNYYLTKQDRAYFAVGEVGTETYANPSAWVPTSRNCRLIEVKIDKEDVARQIQHMRKWYLDLCATRTSVAYDPTRKGDKEVYDFLVAYSQDDGGLTDIAREYSAYRDRLDAITEASKDLAANTEYMKDMLKNVMLLKSITAVGDWKLQRTTRTTYDVAAMKRDGVFEKYAKQEETISIRRKKEA